MIKYNFLTCTQPLSLLCIVETLIVEIDQLLVSEQSFTTMGFESDSSSAIFNCILGYIQFLGYLPVIQPFFIEHDKLMVIDHWYVIGFESDLLSVIKYRAIIYAQFTSYLYIVHAFFV